MRLAYEDKRDLYCIRIFHKMAAGGHFGWLIITFDFISHHLKSICNFHFVWKLFHKMDAGGHFGSPKITFDRISRHFRSIRNFHFLNNFHKMAVGGHFGLPKITFDRISRHFRSIRNFYFLWFFCTKRPPAAILNDRKSLWIAFLALSGLCATFLLLHKMAVGGHFGLPKITFDRISHQLWSIRNFIFLAQFWPKSIRTSLYSRSVATSNMKLIGAFFIKSWSAQACSSYFHKMAAGGHFGFFDILQNQ